MIEEMKMKSRLSRSHSVNKLFWLTGVVCSSAMYVRDLVSGINSSNIFPRAEQDVLSIFPLSQPRTCEEEVPIMKWSIGKRSTDVDFHFLVMA
jgi:hypothetical protein